MLERFIALIAERHKKNSMPNYSNQTQNRNARKRNIWKKSATPEIDASAIDPTHWLTHGALL